MNDAVLDHCREMIRHGSMSFFAAARIFDRPTRESAYMLYAWCRYCDDRVDLQDLGRGGPRTDRASGTRRLEHLVVETRRALAGEPVTEPAFQALGRVVTRHAIPSRYPLDLLIGLRMDVEGRTYGDLDDVLSYCYHVAGVVGVMMAYVMGVRDEPTLDRATDLGLAFQMTNIARDVLDDARAGRVYLPGEWLQAAGIGRGELLQSNCRTALFEVVARLLGEADRYYASSLFGVARLHLRHAWAIAAARRVYRGIGRQMLDRGPGGWDQRAVVGPGRKLSLLLAGLIDAVRALGPGRSSPSPPRTGLWTRSREASPT